MHAFRECQGGTWRLSLKTPASHGLSFKLPGDTDFTIKGSVEVSDAINRICTVLLSLGMQGLSLGLLEKTEGPRTD